MTAATLTAETIKLHLIHTRQPASAGQAGNDASLTQEAIRNAIKALEYADKALASDIETFLVHAGARAHEDVLRGLLSAHPVVRGVSAMALIRMGAPVLPPLEAFAARYAHRETVGWVVDFIRDELGVVAGPGVSLTTAVQAVSR